MRREFFRFFALWGIMGLFLWGCATPEAQTVQATSSQAKAAPSTTKVSRIWTDQLVGKMRVTIEANAELSYTAFKLTDPLRLVLDLPNIDTSNVSEMALNNAFPVMRITPFQFSDGMTTNSRIEIAIARLVPYQVFSDANKLFIDFDVPVKEVDISASPEGALPSGFEELTPASGVKPLSMPSTEPKLIQPVAQNSAPTLEITTPPANVGTVSPMPADVTTGTGASVVNDVQMTQVNGNTRIVVSATRIPEFEIKRTDMPARLMIDLKQSDLPPGNEKMARPDDATSPVKQVRMFQLRRSPQGTDNIVRVLVDLVRPVKHQVSTASGKLIVDLQGESVFTKEEMTPGKNTADVALTSGVESALSGQGTQNAESGVADEPTIRAPKTGSEKEYKGQLISLHFQEADILDVLQVIAEVSGLNLVVHPQVTGTVTVHLTNIPWDQALDIILKMNNLSVEIEGNILRVAQASVFQGEITNRINQQQQVLEARRIQEQLEPLETKLITINFADPASIVSLIEEYFQGANTTQTGQEQTRRGTITVDQRTKTLIVQDTAANIKKIEGIVATLDRRTPQVMIEAKIVTLQTNYSKELGIRWLGNFNADPEHGNALDFRFPYTVNSQNPEGSTAQTTGFGVNLPGTSATDSNGNPLGGTTGWLRFGSIDDVFTLFARIDAAEIDNKAKTLSQPKIFTQDNVPAQVSSTQTRTIPGIGDNTQSTTVSAPLSLSVTPRISNDGYITMVVQVSNTRFESATLTNLATTGETVTSQVTVKDGGTVVIGGIFLTSEGSYFTGVPFLHKIPILGHLFKSTNPNSSTQSELLVFLTPRILDKNVVAPEDQDAADASFVY
ncbi:PilQ protein [Candidatus Moduliflexus flocculans]|uniref:PilQ protein n=1 Tax=Candidatus Moduliflexus flocculans TaxID=1499966 RepID=A0A0S6W3E6_9BACT|nr:PilQ protein [Candidatus Moduliflexus flocculans]